MATEVLVGMESELAVRKEKSSRQIGQVSVEKTWKKRDNYSHLGGYPHGPGLRGGKI